MSKTLTEFEEVAALNPVTHQIDMVKIEKPVKRTPEKMAEHTKAELAKMGLQPVQKITVRDPLTGESKEITLSRAGYNEVKLIEALADPKLTRDRKDFELSMYIYERGMHNTSMVVDLMRYKGAHTKETRVFKAQIRFDFEAFVNGFATYLADREKISETILGINIREERANYLSFVAERKAKDRELDPDAKPKLYTYLDYFMYKEQQEHGKLPNPDMTMRMWANQVMLSMHDADESDVMVKRMRAMAEAREQDRGKGIYLDRAGRPYVVTDPDLDDIIKRDREITAEATKDNE